MRSAEIMVIVAYDYKLHKTNQIREWNKDKLRDL